MSSNSFGARATFKVGNKEYELYRLDALDKQGISTRHLPFSLRILLENLLRTEDGRNVTKRFARSRHGTRIRSRKRKSPSLPAVFCCRISPAFQRLWILPPCATR